jgi:hypothetical protein
MVDIPIHSTDKDHVTTVVDIIEVVEKKERTQELKHLTTHHNKEQNLGEQRTNEKNRFTRSNP